MTAAERDDVRSADLVARLGEGDAEAAAVIFERYAARLVRLAQSRLASKLAARVDADDVMMSAFRSFFVGAREGQFAIKEEGDLWRLLAQITLQKLFRISEHHLAQKRSVDREQPATGNETQLISGPRNSAPDCEVAAADELEVMLNLLSEREREAVELRLVGLEIEEIAIRLQCSGRTVRRNLNAARRILISRAGSEFVVEAARRGAQPLAETAMSTSLCKLPAATLAWKDYLLREQIGAGASGRVYRAQRRSDRQLVAVKFLRKSLTRSARMVERFVQEAATVSRSSHPGIVQMHGIGQTPGGGLFLVMNLVDGGSLAEIAARRPLRTGEIARWIADAAAAIEIAHEAGVIHCDIKPSNLLLDSQERVQVSDFGLAVSRGDDSATSLSGTPAFIAPEQVDSRWGRISSRTDVWGLGSVLYFLLYGQPPNRGGSLSALLADAASASAVLFPARSEAQELMAVAARCLAKRPEDRFPSAAAVAHALAALSIA